MSQFFGFLRNVGVTVTCACVFFDKIAYVAKVEGVSMQPTLNDEPNIKDIRKYNGIRGYLNRIDGADLVLLCHWSVRNYDIRRGDIISLISPKNPNQLIIKRVIGLEGDLITARASGRYASMEIPRGKCWIEGDNSKKSMDSNTFGPISKGLIQSKAQCIVWPPRRWRMLPPKYPSDRLVSPINTSAHNDNNSGVVNFRTLQPLNIEICDHHTRIDDAQLFMEAAEIE